MVPSHCAIAFITNLKSYFSRVTQLKHFKKWLDVVFSASEEILFKRVLKTMSKVNGLWFIVKITHVKISKE